MNKIIKQKKILLLLLCFCGFIRGEIVIMEFFILSEENSHVPQYIELFNNSAETVSLENWSIKIFSGNGTELNLYTTFNNSDCLCDIYNTQIEPFSYFLISSKFQITPFGAYFYNNLHADIEAEYLYLPFDIDFSETKGTIKLLDDNSITIDEISYDIANPKWEPLLSIDSRGHSLRLHSPLLDANNEPIDNSDPLNWSLSPETENSLWLYNKGTEIQNFGSPREENSFQLHNIHYSDLWFTEIEIDTGGTHAIYGDVNDFYRSEPYEDFGTDQLPDTGDEGEGNGIWELGEAYHDRNLNNMWDYQDNNYNVPLAFSWLGTFIDTTVIDTPAISYEIIIEKNNTRLYNPSLFDSLGTEISILPLDLLINSLGEGREIAEYTWTVELTKTFSNDSTDTIYSDKYTFIIDASDYGRYGCVDNGSCADDGNCPTNAYYESSYMSNHPTGCTPSIPGIPISDGGCYSALNYYEDANINSNTCHYVSLSIPAYVTGNPTTQNNFTSVPVYLDNDSSAVVDSIAYTLSYDYDSSAEIIFYEDGTFAGTVLGDIVDGVIDTMVNVNTNTGNILVNIRDLSFYGAGIVTYINLDLSNLSASRGLSFSDVIIKGGTPENNITNIIQVPIKEGDMVYLQESYHINGRVQYYDKCADCVESTEESDLFEVPDVEVTLIKKPYGNSNVDTSYYSTYINGYFEFSALSEGHYTLSFSKDADYDAVCPNPEKYVSVLDVSDIAQYVVGDTADITFSPNNEIAADVSLDGTVSSLDVSLVAQYIIDLIDSFNESNIYWIFKPRYESTLDSIYADLIYHDGQFEIEYSPLVFDDISRYISAYHLGDVDGNYCFDYSPINNGERYSEKNPEFKNLNINYRSDLPISIIMSEPTQVKGLFIEIGYNDSVFNPLSFSFDPSGLFPGHYESMSNLYSKNGTIKAIIWATGQPQLISGLLGEITFNWENENTGGEIWLEKFTVNDQYADGIITLSGYEGEGDSDGLKIINELYPEKLSLKQNYPNPFNPETSIYWTMPNSGSVQLEIYNLRGQLVDVLFSGYKRLGTHEIIWNALGYSSGIYFYRLTINGAVLQKKMILLR